MVVTDNNPLTYVLTTAKLDATGQRSIADLSNYNFTIKYRSGKKNVDADALSRQHLGEVEESNFPEIIKAISSSISADRPFAEGLAVSGDTVDTDEAILEDLLESTALRKQDWIKAQRQEPAISCIIDSVNMNRRPSAQQVAVCNVDRRYIREWEKLFIRDGLLYRNATVNGQKCEQLVLPYVLKEEIFNAYTMTLVIKGGIGRYP